MPFDDAAELVFRCPTCNKLLHHYDNSELVKTLEAKIQQIERETSIKEIVDEAEQIESELTS